MHHNLKRRRDQLLNGEIGIFMNYETENENFTDNVDMKLDSTFRPGAFSPILQDDE